MPVIQLPGLNPNRQPILLRRQRARRIRRKRTRRVLGLVEVHHHLAVLREIGVEESSGRIGLFPASEIAKDKEEMVVFYYRVQALRLAIECEERIPGSYLARSRPKYSEW